MSTANVTLLVWIAIVIGGCAGYAGWAWWIGPVVGAAAGLINLMPALSDPFVRLGGLLAGAVFNVGLFGGLPYGMYALVRWFVG
jgi:hypothetical protein